MSERRIVRAALLQASWTGYRERGLEIGSPTPRPKIPPHKKVGLHASFPRPS